MGLRIFQHSVELVFKQLSGALRISGVLYLLAFAIWGAGLLLTPAPMYGQPATVSWQMVVALILSVLIYLWIAVGWHRFVLLDEAPNAPLPPFHGDRILAYLARALQSSFILAFAAIALFTLSSLIAVATRSFVFSIIALLVVLTISFVIGYRLAPMLPGAAVGKSVGVGAAWTATSGASGAIVSLAIVSAIASIVVDLPTLLLVHLPAGPILAFTWVSISSWVKLMVGVSIMTTLYGVYVEKRTIA